MLLYIKPQNDKIKNYYINHGTFHSGDSGLDLFVPEDIIVPKGARGFMIDHQISCETLHMLTPSSFWLISRSSISKTPLRMSNSIGLIDAAYRGPIIGAVDNLSDKEYLIKAGSRLFQITTPFLDRIDFYLTDKLSETSRGDGGFGSTG